MKSLRNRKRSSLLSTTFNKLKKLEKCANKNCKHIAATQPDISTICLQRFPMNKNAELFDKKENEMYRKRVECKRKEESKPEYRRIREDIQKCIKKKCEK